MSSLFSSPQAAKPQAPPSIDVAQSRVSEKKRGGQLRGRAANILSTNTSAGPTAARAVTGN